VPLRQRLVRVFLEAPNEQRGEGRKADVPIGEGKGVASGGLLSYMQRPEGRSASGRKPGNTLEVSAAAGRSQFGAVESPLPPLLPQGLLYKARGALDNKGPPPAKQAGTVGEERRRSGP